MDRSERILYLMYWYDNLSTEDKRALAKIVNKGKADSNASIEQKIDGLAELVRSENRFSKDLLSNILGNYITDASIYLLARLLRIK